MQACRDLLGTLEEHGKLHTLTCPLASGREVVLEANQDGKFNCESLKPMFKKLGIAFHKLLGFQILGAQEQTGFYPLHKPMGVLYFMSVESFHLEPLTYDNQVSEEATDYSIWYHSWWNHNGSLSDAWFNSLWYQTLEGFPLPALSCLVSNGGKSYGYIIGGKLPRPIHPGQSASIHQGFSCPWKQKPGSQSPAAFPKQGGWLHQWEGLQFESTGSSSSKKQFGNKDLCWIHNPNLDENGWVHAISMFAISRSQLHIWLCLC